jgi:hypothetical protein
VVLAGGVDVVHPHRGPGESTRHLVEGRCQHAFVHLDGHEHVPPDEIVGYDVDDAAHRRLGLAKVQTSLVLRDDPAGMGYLPKDRITDTAILTSAIERVASGETVVDP